jgi:hypothetical protein
VRIGPPTLNDSPHCLFTHRLAKPCLYLNSSIIQSFPYVVSVIAQAIRAKQHPRSERAWGAISP